MDKTLFTVIGYIVFIAYTCSIMFLGTLIEKKTSADKTLCRKITHVVSAFVWIICYFFFGSSLHWVILNGVGAVALGVITFGNLMKTYDRDDADKSYGLFFFGLATFVVALISYLLGEETYFYAGIAYFCLAFGDGFAPIVARLLKARNPLIMPGRTLWGTVTVFAVSLAVTWTFSAIFKMGLDPLFIVSVAALTCVAEFYGLKGLDNLVIDFSVFGYLLLYHYGLVTPILEIVIIVSAVLACVAIRTKSLSVSGGIAALLLFLLVGFFGEGWLPVVFVTVLFLIATAVAFITQKIYNAENGKRAKTMRTGRQIIAVGLAAVISLIVYYFTRIFFFYGLFFLALTEQFADSMASDIGRLTKGKNVDIIRFKTVEKGLSGGVSLLGTLCAFISCFALMAIPFAFGAVDLKYYLAISSIAFFGTIIDSVLGSLVQALYMCNVCGTLTEEKVHCSDNARLIKGFARIENTTVNLLTSFLSCIAGCLLLI